MQEKKLLQLKELELLKKRKELAEGLPHLYGFKFYPWAREFFDSTNRMNLLCAGNQISKSSTQIRKCIDWATDTKKWPRLWQIRPLQFWYLYPTKETATIEFEKKWVEEFLPRGEYEKHPVYGWKKDYDKKHINAIHFNSRVSVYFKTYAQQVKHLQSGSCNAVFCDEELPYDLFPELKMRLAGTRGYFHMVFTATMGQVEWEDAIEPKNPKREKFKSAFKQQVSMYDCLKYEDGSNSSWTVERIKEEEQMIGDPREIKKRIHGKFVVTSGLKYEGFDRDRNFIEPKEPPPASWGRYMGVDIGSGKNADSRNNSHPGAIYFVAVNPEHTFGRIYKGWRGDHESTTAGDCFNKAIELRGLENMHRQFYDWQCKDFGLIAGRAGEPFEKAEKGQDLGTETLNTLFRFGMLVIDDVGDPELEKLVAELCNVKKDDPKQSAKDDATDAVRYATVLIPWNFNHIKFEVKRRMEKAKPQTEEQRRIEWWKNSVPEGIPFGNELLEDEIAAYNELYEI